MPRLGSTGEQTGLYGESLHNTYWNGSLLGTGRDVTGICTVLKMESDGLHYYHAVSDTNGVRFLLGQRFFM